MRPVIEIENLTKYYGKHRGIEDLNLVVDEGEFFWIYRAERSGKEYYDPHDTGAFETAGR